MIECVPLEFVSVNVALALYTFPLFNVNVLDAEIVYVLEAVLTYEYTGKSVAVFQEPLDLTCKVIVHVAFEAFTSKLPYADTLPLVLLFLVTPTLLVVVDLGAISFPSLTVGVSAVFSD